MFRCKEPAIDVSGCSADTLARIAAVYVQSSGSQVADGAFSVKHWKEERDETVRSHYDADEEPLGPQDYDVMESNSGTSLESNLVLPRMLQVYIGISSGLDLPIPGVEPIRLDSSKGP